MEAILLGAGVLIVFFYVALILLYVIAAWKVYTKAEQPGWAVIIPLYNAWILLKIVGKPVWWLLLFLIPGVNVIFSIWTTNLLSKSFGKNEAFTVGLIFLPFVFYPILGFGSAKYQGPAGADTL